MQSQLYYEDRTAGCGTDIAYDDRSILACPIEAAAEILQQSGDCPGCAASTVAGVRAHVKRHHRNDLQFCGRCGTYFSSHQIDFGRHYMTGCIPRHALPEHTANKEEWYALYQFLTPGVPLPGDLYNRTSVHLSKAQDPASVAASQNLDVAEFDLFTNANMRISRATEKRHRDRSGGLLGISSFASRIERRLWEHSASREGVKGSLLEIVSFCISAICMASIIGVLGFFNDKTLPHWSLGLTLNTFISVFARVASMALWFPVYVALLRWEWELFKGNGDFEELDNALRGPWGWGSFVFFLRTNGKVLAAMSATWFLFELGVDLSFKQAVVFLRKDVNMLPGSVYGEEPILMVRWAWLAPPLASLGLTWIFLMKALSAEKRQEGVWKTSATATLLQDLPDGTQEKIKSSQATGTPRTKAKELKAIWLPENRWRVSGSDMRRALLRPRYSSNAIGKGYHPNQEYRQDVEENAGSTLSVQPLVLSSTARELLKFNRFEEMLTVFQKDDGFILCSRRVIEDPNIGPDRLYQDLQRLFKQCAEQLIGVAVDQLEHQASQLVSLRAEILSQCIVDGCTHNAVARNQQTQIVEESTENHEDERNLEDYDSTAAEDIYVKGLRTFRDLLISSKAFQTFCSEVEYITSSKLSLKTKKGDMATKNNLEPVQIKASVVAGHILHSFKKFLIVTGYLEHPLEPRMVRLRWECRCGERFTADVREYEPGGATELKTFVEALVNGRVTSTQYSPNSTNQKAIHPQPRLWLQRIFSILGMALKGVPKPDTLPQHNLNSTAIQSPQGMPLESPKILYLLACMRSAQLGKTLHQGCIDDIDTDRKLFCFLRQVFQNYRGRVRSLLSLKKVKGIHFTKFNLFAGGSVEVRHHSHCCENICECIPPQSRVEPSDQAEYRCKPAGPLRSGPPILSDILEHFFSRPSCIPEHNVSILNRLPKRICGELQGSMVEPAEGWGIYFQEGWDGDIITMVAFTIFLIGSLLFGVLWSCFKMDLQGAFGVSAYIMTANAIVISLVATKAGKL